MFMIPTKRIEATIYFWNIPNAGQPTQFIYGTYLMQVNQHNLFMEYLL